MKVVKIEMRVQLPYPDLIMDMDLLKSRIESLIETTILADMVTKEVTIQ